MAREGALKATREDWDTDTVKHYVRFHGWGPACKDRAEGVRRAGRRSKEPLKYFTLCAGRAVDVFMLSRLGVLRVDVETNRLQGVCWCEVRDNEAAEIERSVGGVGFRGRLEDILLFEDDADTRRYTLDDEPEKRIRRKLNIKSLHEGLRGRFPFDILNLDFCGQFFPPDEPFSSPMLRLIDRMLEWQRDADDQSCDSFTLLLTSCIRKRRSQDAMAELTTRLHGNMKESPLFRAAYDSAFGGIDPQSLGERDLPAFFSVALPKVIASRARERQWSPIHKGTFIYTKRDPRTREFYRMLSWVAHFNRVTGQARKGNQRDPLYEKAITDAIAHGPVDVQKALSSRHVKREVKKDLDAVKEHRGKYWAAISGTSN